MEIIVLVQQGCVLNSKSVAWICTDLYSSVINGVYIARSDSRLNKHNPVLEDLLASLSSIYGVKPHN